MISTNPTAKQHFIPRFYLKAFADARGLLHVLDLKNRRINKPRPYQALGYEHYYYALETGVPDDVSQDVEDWLQQIENAIARDFPFIATKLLGSDPIEEGERYVVAVLMSMLWLRSPGMRALINKTEETMTKDMMRFFPKERINQFSRETGASLSEERRAELLEMMKNGTYHVSSNNAQHLRLMVESLGFNGPGFANMFNGHRWTAHIARGRRRFITTDTPVVEWCPPRQTFHGASFMERDKFFALTPYVLLELTHRRLATQTKVKRKTFFGADDDTVMMFNILLADRSQGLVYSTDRATTEDMLVGLTQPGVPEMMYYKRFLLPRKAAKEDQSRRAMAAGRR